VVKRFEYVLHATTERHADELKLIIWEGYADDTYRKPFEEANQVTVSPTEAGTGDEMFALMRESDGKNYDMVSASSDLPRRLYDAGLLAEIDTTKLSNYNKLYDQFKTPDYITFDGKLYCVNCAWDRRSSSTTPRRSRPSRRPGTLSSTSSTPARSRPGITRSRSRSTRSCSIRNRRTATRRPTRWWPRSIGWRQTDRSDRTCTK